MKFASLIFFLTFVSFVFVIFPIWLIALNYSFALPLYDFPLFKVVGVFLITVGALVCLNCLISFLKLGEGTPVPISPPQKLVSSNLYRRSRNPMYLGSLMIVLGEFFFFGHLSLLFYFLVLAPIYHAYVVLFEEPGLKKRFGQPYEEYLKRTPRWL